MSMQRVIDDLRQRLHDKQVDWLVVGDWALAAHGMARHSFDLDIMIGNADVPSTEAILATCGYVLLGSNALVTRYRSPTPGSPDINVHTVDTTTMSALSQAATPAMLGAQSVRVPAPMHLLAMKMHVYQSDPGSRARALSDIAGLVKAGGIAPDSAELHSLCTRYGSEELWKEISSPANPAS